MPLAENLVGELLGGNRRALARVISLIENDAPEKETVLAQLFPHTGRAHYIGFTGAPGAGKSSLVDKFTSHVRKLGLTVGIVAIDPSSPFTGGALLGDRIRMQEHALDTGVFIRSMGTRGSLGGLARSTKQVMKILDAYGKDLVLVETVGVGQSELDVAQAADTTVVILTPASGDAIQTLKAGIMEIADVFVVNKSDLPGANEMIRDINAMLDLAPKREWRPPVIATNAMAGEGVAELYVVMEKHWQFLGQEGRGEKRRQERLQQEVLETAIGQLREELFRGLAAEPELQDLLHRVCQREIDPYTAAREVLVRFGSLVFSKESLVSPLGGTTKDGNM